MLCIICAGTTVLSTSYDELGTWNFHLGVCVEMKEFDVYITLQAQFMSFQGGLSSEANCALKVMKISDSNATCFYLSKGKDFDLS